jgi:hypothetical protein
MKEQIARTSGRSSCSSRRFEQEGGSLKREAFLEGETETLENILTISPLLLMIEGRID